jgi:hypothetical protein
MPEFPMSDGERAWCASHPASGFRRGPVRASSNQVVRPGSPPSPPGSATLPPGFGDLLGRKRVFLLGVAVFGAASLAAGLAHTPGELIATRVVQGLRRRR